MTMPRTTTDDLPPDPEDVFAKRKQASDVGQHKPANWDAETAKIARLRQMRLARDAQIPPKKGRGVTTVPIRIAGA